MNIFEVLADLTGLFGPPRPDNDNSIVGKSPIEEGISRFWRRVGTVLFVGLLVFALYRSGSRSRDSKSTAPIASPSPAASR